MTRSCWEVFQLGALFLFANSAFAASDQALRAMYCMPILDGMIAEDRQLAPAMAPTAAEYYGAIARQRPLTEKERGELADAQRDSARGFTESGRVLTANRERLRVYALTNSAADDTLPLLAAKRRGEIDYGECRKEQSSTTSCTYQCGKGCTPGDTSCFQRCYASCGAPTCARTSVCINPTWLPY